MSRFFSNLACCTKSKRLDEPKNKDPPAQTDQPPQNPPTDAPQEDAPPSDATVVQPTKTSPPPPPADVRPQPSLYPLNTYITDKLKILKATRESKMNKIYQKIMSSALIQKLVSKKTIFQKKSSEVETFDPALMNYNCPICAYLACGLRAWKHFEKCLMAALATDPVSYAVYAVIGLNPKVQSQASQNIIIQYLSNIIDYPGEPQYRKIRTKNPLFYEGVYPIIGGLKIFEICGFESVILPNNSIPEVFLILPPTQSTEAVKLTRQLIKIAEPLLPIPSRNIMYVRYTDEEKVKWIENTTDPDPTTIHITSPTGWVDFSSIDHRKSTIRFELTDQLCIEASFLFTETAQDLYKFIWQFFLTKDLKLNLTKLDKTVLNQDSTSLSDLNMTPKALLIVTWQPDDNSDRAKIINNIILYDK